jgi:hypothetical protein
MGCDSTCNGAAIELPEAVDPGMDISLEHFHAYMPQHGTSSRRRGDVAAEEVNSGIAPSPITANGQPVLDDKGKPQEATGLAPGSTSASRSSR